MARTFRRASARFLLIFVRSPNSNAIASIRTIRSPSDRSKKFGVSADRFKTCRTAIFVSRRISSPRHPVAESLSKGHPNLLDQLLSAGLPPSFNGVGRDDEYADHDGHDQAKCI